MSWPTAIPPPIISFDKAVYYPGDTVTATIVFENAAPINYRSIDIRWSAKSKTWNVKCLEPSSTNYFVTSPSLFWEWAERGNLFVIPAGKHTCISKTELPLKCLPSFHGSNGKNSYKYKISINTPWKLDIKAEKEFLVTKKLTVHRNFLKEETFEQIFPSGHIVSKGPIEIGFTLPKRCFSPGETVHCEFAVRNYTPEAVDHIFVELHKKVHYHACSQRVPCDEFTKCPLTSSDQKNSWSIIGKAEKLTINQPTLSRSTYNVFYTIPTVGITPSFSSGLITVSYYLYFGFKAMHRLAQPKCARIWIFIGEVDNNPNVENKENDKEIEVRKMEAPPAYTP